MDAPTPVCQLPTSLDLAHCSCKVFAVCLNETTLEIEWVRQGRRRRHGGVSSPHPHAYAEADGSCGLQRPVRAKAEHHTNIIQRSCCQSGTASTVSACGHVAKAILPLPSLARDRSDVQNGAPSKNGAQATTTQCRAHTPAVGLECSGRTLQCAWRLQSVQARHSASGQVHLWCQAAASHEPCARAAKRGCNLCKSIVFHGCVQLSLSERELRLFFGKR